MGWPERGPIGGAPRETRFVDDRQPDELLLTTEQRNELAGIAYLLAQCENLHARGLIADEALGTIRAEYADRRAALETQGFCEAALADARRLMVPQPSAACARADRARALDPTRPEAWALAIEARKGWKDDEGMALAAEAVARFPGFPVTPADLQHERDVREARAEQQQRPHRRPTPTCWRKPERHSMHRRDEEVVELNGALLDPQPRHFETRVLRAFALQRLNRLEEAARGLSAARDPAGRLALGDLGPVESTRIEGAAGGATPETSRLGSDGRP